MKNERKVLKNKSVLLGVTGSIAAYKAVDLIRRLKDEGLSVTVVMTESAKNFITPLSLEAASQNKVYTDLFINSMAHIELSSQADLLIVAPATANIIGKFARGIADDLLSTCFLAFNGTTVIAPSMNWRMYENPFFQENLRALLSRGIIQIGPEKGSLACGEEGTGRMSDVSDIIECTKSIFTKKDLSNEKILVTAGPTREYLDPVRFISNKSSGKMGFAIARAALRRGAEVTLISGYSSLKQPKGLKFISVETSQDMLNAVNKELRDSTVIIMSAAVSDFSPVETSKGKIKKTDELILRFRKTTDIISQIANKKNRPFIIGFSAETGWHIERAKKKLREKKMDMIVLNNISEKGSGFDTDTNKVIIIDNQKQTSLPLMSKESVADALLDRMKKIKA